MGRNAVVKQQMSKSNADNMYNNQVELNNFQAKPSVTVNQFFRPPPESRGQFTNSNIGAVSKKKSVASKPPKSSQYGNNVYTNKAALNKTQTESFG